MWAWGNISKDEYQGPFSPWHVLEGNSSSWATTWRQDDYSEKKKTPNIHGLVIAPLSPLGCKNMASEVDPISVYDSFWFYFTKPWTS